MTPPAQRRPWSAVAGCFGVALSVAVWFLLGVVAWHFITKYW